MKYFLVFLALIVQSHADTLLINNSTIYNIPNKVEVFSTEVTNEDTLKNVSFLKITPIFAMYDSGSGRMKEYLKERQMSVSPAIPEFVWSKNPKTGPLPKDEDCGSNPMKWLGTGKQIANLKKPLKREVFYIQIPDGFKDAKITKDFESFYLDFYKKSAGLSDLNAESLKNVADTIKRSRMLSKDKYLLVYLIHQGEMKEDLIIFIKNSGGKWSAPEELTFTLEYSCP